MLVKTYTDSVLQGISPILKYWPHPFLPSPPPQKICHGGFFSLKIYTKERDLYELAKNISILT